MSPSVRALTALERRGRRASSRVKARTVAEPGPGPDKDQKGPEHNGPEPRHAPDEPDQKELDVKEPG